MEKAVIFIAVLLIVILMLIIKINGLYKMAYMDYLTGTYNRRYFEQYFHKLKHRKNFVLSCVMLDINNFKKINDEHGHSAGDEVLKHTAALLRELLGASRKTGFIVRYGGDEFFMVLHTDNFQELEKIAGQVRGSDKYRKASYSVGYDVYDPLRWSDFELYVHHIDTLMYKDKKQNYWERSSVPIAPAGNKLFRRKVQKGGRGV